MSSIEQIDAELARLQAEMSSVERAPPSFEEVWPVVEAELTEAESTFRRVGPQLSGVVSQLPEHINERHRAMVGMALVANRKAVVDSERTRVQSLTKGGISAADKARRVAQIRAAILTAAARKEMALRAVEGVGEFQTRDVHPELAVFTRAEVQRLAG